MSELGFWRFQIRSGYIYTFLSFRNYEHIVKMLDFGEQDVAFKLPIHLFSMCDYLEL